MDMLSTNDQTAGYIYLLIFVLGSCIGSFLNVVILRLPGLIDKDLSDPSEHPQANLIRPASRCPKCKTRISWYDNIPLLSYLMLKGACRHCHSSISKQYFYVELVTGLLYVSCFLKFGFSDTFLFSLIFTSILISLAMIDLNCWLLPDIITLPGIALGLICNYFGHFTSIGNAAIGAISGYLVLWLIYQAHYRITGREGMGYGDFKLLSMLGAWLGWYALPIVLLVSSISGLVIFLFAKIVYKFDHTQPLPFGPFLAIAGWIYLIGHLKINQWLMI